MVVDLDAIAQRVADTVASRLLERLPEIVRAEFDRRLLDGLMDSVALATYLGISRDALAQRLRRGSALGEIALNLDDRQVWRRSDVDSLLVRQPKLRAVGGER